MIAQPPNTLLDTSFYIELLGSLEFREAVVDAEHKNTLKIRLGQLLVPAVCTFSSITPLSNVIHDKPSSQATLVSNSRAGSG